ncbi:uncharacterized protein [Epargyreus clarus]|uniref:uncharacterized protein n=1 Tax=Epargyreus clarus TaxID=520877 RepID=UPI003C2CC739
MEGYSSSDSNISLDSLETEFKKKLTSKKVSEKTNVDTILVPFYEKDVLIEVPKGKKKQVHGNYNVGDKFKKEFPPIKNYLVNKDTRKPKRTSYLEMFRKQFSPMPIDSSKIHSEIRSISPEFGDTERESFGEEGTDPRTDFFNSESYNEIYYEKLINQELNNYLEKTYEEQLKFPENFRSKSPENIADQNLRSISDVSQPRHRNLQRTAVQPIQNVKLGGLGPDMENIKPRLERARSLQRYSEKVRMENRVRIYKKSVQEDMEKKAEKELIGKRQESAKNKERQVESAKAKERKDTEKSYLINKNMEVKQSQIVRRICNSKSKSANVQRTRDNNETNDKLIVKKYSPYNDQNKQLKKTMDSKVDNSKKGRIKSCLGNKNQDSSDIKQVPVPPVQISFLVNMGGLRPSSALRSLEAKHRIYQEKVRAFTITGDKDNDNI